MPIGRENSFSILRTMACAVAELLGRRVAHIDAEHVGARLEQGADRLFVVGGRTEGGDDLDATIASHCVFASPSGSVRRTVQSRSSPVSTSKNPVRLKPRFTHSLVSRMVKDLSSVHI